MIDITSPVKPLWFDSDLIPCKIQENIFTGRRLFARNGIVGWYVCMYCV